MKRRAAQACCETVNALYHRGKSAVKCGTEILQRWLAEKRIVSEIVKLEKAKNKTEAQEDRLLELKQSAVVQASEKAEIEDAAKLFFGITDDYHEAGFITTDGYALDFSGVNDPDEDVRSYAKRGVKLYEHADLEMVLPESIIREYKYATGREIGIDIGMIRVVPSKPGRYKSLYLSLGREPTAKQYYAIRDAIDQYIDEGEPCAFGWDVAGTNAYFNYRLENIKAGTVIADMKRHFTSGDVQTTVGMFHFSEKLPRDYLESIEDKTIKCPQALYSEALTWNADKPYELVRTAFQGYNYYYWLDGEYKIHFVKKTPFAGLRKLSASGKGRIKNAGEYRKRTDRPVHEVRSGERDNRRSVNALRSVESGRTNTADQGYGSERGNEPADAFVPVSEDSLKYSEKTGWSGSEKLQQAESVKREAVVSKLKSVTGNGSAANLQP